VFEYVGDAAGDVARSSKLIGGSPDTKKGGDAQGVAPSIV